MPTHEQHEDLVRAIERELRVWRWLRWVILLLALSALGTSCFATLEIRRGLGQIADAARETPEMFAILSDGRAFMYVQHGIGQALAIAALFWVAMSWHRVRDRALLHLLKVGEKRLDPPDA